MILKCTLLYLVHKGVNMTLKSHYGATCTDQKKKKKSYTWLADSYIAAKGHQTSPSTELKITPQRADRS